jgi:uncharacterized protein with von Willebrand factor type A (vWA) domain
MQDAMIRFIATLRCQHVRVSTAETLDAMQAAASVGLCDRTRLRHALCISLAKTPLEKSIVANNFDRFFSANSANQPPLAAEDASNESDQREQSTENPLLLARETLSNAAQNDPVLQELLHKKLAAMLMRDDAVALSAAFYKAAADADLDTLKIFTQKGIFGRRMLDALGERELSAISRHVAEHEPALSTAVDTLRKYVQQEVREHIDQHFLRHATGQQQRQRDALLREVRLSHIERHHQARMQELVRQLARRLAARNSRKPCASQRGIPDLRRSLRQAAGLDGLLLNPRWRQRRKEPGQLMAICDVSGSVAAHAKFLLMFLHSLSDVLPKVRSFAFSSELGEISELLGRHDAAAALEMAYQRFGGSTDYGRSLTQFQALTEGSIGPRTTVLILGDARNNYGPARVDILAGIAKRAKQLLWFNPEARYGWGTGDSEMLRYAPYCHKVLPCGSLRQLESAVDQLLRCTV